MPGIATPSRQAALRKLLDRVHAACVARRVLHFAYTRLDGERSERSVRPLASSGPARLMRRP